MSNNKVVCLLDAEQLDR